MTRTFRTAVIACATAVACATTSLPAATAAIEPAELARARDGYIDFLRHMGCPAVFMLASPLEINYKDFSAQALIPQVTNVLRREHSAAIAEGQPFGGKDFSARPPAEQQQVIAMSGQAIGTVMAECLAPLRAAGSSGF